MDVFNLYALRLGFSTQEAPIIKNVGLEAYIKQQLNQKNTLKDPDFLNNSPKNLQV